MKVYLLSGGLIDLDRSVIHPGDDSGRHLLVPCPQVLLQNQGKTVLVDTGMPPAAVGDELGLERTLDISARRLRPLVSREEGLAAQLEFLGLRPADLDLVINTHLHFDHAGGNPLFPGVTIAVQEEELVAGREDGSREWWDAPDLVFEAVRGDWSPLPGVEMLLTPGHSPGHQSMLVRVGSENWLFTWDAVYTEEHWRGNKLGAVADVPQARASLDRLRDLAERESARVIFGHDRAQWDALGMSESIRPRLIASDE